MKKNQTASEPQIEARTTIRSATLGELHRNIVPLYVAPVPALSTFRSWLDRENVPRMKSNPSAKRGGGPCYYHVPSVERMLRRHLPGRLQSEVA